MSLFPAYSNVESTANEGQTEQEGDGKWLDNSSFVCNLRKDASSSAQEEQIVTTNSNQLHIEKDDNDKQPARQIEKRNRKKKKTKRSKDKSKRSKDAEVVETLFTGNEKYCIDVNRQIGYLTVEKLIRPAVPRYYTKFIRNLSPYITNLARKKQNRRYFGGSRRPQDKPGSGSLEAEVEAGKTIEQFNKALTSCPSDVQMWMDFVNYQDDYFRFQHIQHKSVAERDRAAALHKLSILERGMAANKSSDKLQTMWLDIASNVLTSEEASNQIQYMVKQYGSNMTLLFGQIAMVQHSLARCTVSSVSALYDQALASAYKGLPYETQDGNLSVLELLTHLCRFEEQCGQWETMLTTLKLYLDLNLDCEWRWPEGVADEEVTAAEDAVVTADAPLWHMWLRVETMREAAHYAPVVSSPNYPQRVVASREVAPMVYHLHRKTHLQLLVTVVCCLKVPLLPMTHSLVSMLTPHGLPWVHDTVENILSSALVPPVLSLKSSHLKNVSSLTTGPQYLRRTLGQKELLDLIEHTFLTLIGLVDGRQRSVLGVWWLRFQRWLLKLETTGIAVLPPQAKPPRQVFKDFLKDEKNRENVLFYREFSQMEFERGNQSFAMKTVRTVIDSKPPVLSAFDPYEQAVLSSLYRTLVEQHVASGDVAAAMTVLSRLACGHESADTDLVNSKFLHVARELVHHVSADKDVCLEDLFLPVFVVEWVTCYIWYIALHSSPRAAMEYLKSVLEDLPSSTAGHIKESLWEAGCTITWVLNREDQRAVTSVLSEAFTMFPYNTLLLSMMTSKELEGSCLWWTMSNTFLTPPTSLGAVFLACTGLERFHTSPEDMKPSLANRVQLLLQRLSRQEGRLSSICHRLYLRFLRTWQDSFLEAAHVHAMECCPWNKGIYMEGIGLLPGQLIQLTDVMVEKDLRIHITPDELQEMRA